MKKNKIILPAANTAKLACFYIGKGTYSYWGASNDKHLIENMAYPKIGFDLFYIDANYKNDYIFSVGYTTKFNFINEEFTDEEKQTIWFSYRRTFDFKRPSDPTFSYWKTFEDMIDFETGCSIAHYSTLINQATHIHIKVETKESHVGGGYALAIDEQFTMEEVLNNMKVFNIESDLLPFRNEEEDTENKDK